MVYPRGVRDSETLCYIRVVSLSFTKNMFACLHICASILVLHSNALLQLCISVLRHFCHGDEFDLCFSLLFSTWSQLIDMFLINELFQFDDFVKISMNHRAFQLERYCIAPLYAKVTRGQWIRPRDCSAILKIDWCRLKMRRIPCVVRCAVRIHTIEAKYMRGTRRSQLTLSSFFRVHSCEYLLNIHLSRKIDSYRRQNISCEQANGNEG